MVTVTQGDILKVNFNPQKGHEQAGYRPAVVVSNRLINNKTSLAFLCPITHTRRGNPFHYELCGYEDVDGFVMCDRLKTMDLNARQFEVIGYLSGNDTTEIIRRIEMIVEKE